jgi:hypothetical protein
MANNMTRKGLAIASAATMAVFGLVAPSFGAQSDTSKVSLAPADGTAYAVVAATLSGTFQLEANEAANIVGGDVSFLVADEDAVVFPVLDNGAGDVETTGLSGTDYEVAAADDEWSRTATGTVTVTFSDNGGDALNVGDIIYVANGALPDAGAGVDVAEGYYTISAASDANNTISFVDGVANDEAATATGSDADGIIYVASRDADDNSFVISSGVANNTTNELLTLTTMGEDSVSVNVTAWVDDDNDGVIDETEYASRARTVTWLAADDISVASIDWTAQLGAASVSVDVTFSPAINWDQSEELDGVLSNAAGQFAAADATFAEDDGVITWTKTNNNLADATLNTGYVTLRVYTESGNELISTNRYRVEDNGIDDFEIDAVTGSNVAQSATDGDVTVREETTRVVLEVKVVDDEDNGIAGIDVVVSDGGASSLDADAVVTVGGKAVDEADGSFDDVTIRTNADGVASLVITSTDGANADSLDLDFTAEAETDTVVVAWADADYYFYYTPSVTADDAAPETTRWLGEGKSTTVTFVAFDQWGSAPKANTFRVKTTIDQDDADGDALDTVYKYSAFGSNGQASVTVADVAKSNEDVSAAFELQGYDEDGDTWSDTETVAGSIGDDDIDGTTLTFTTGEDSTVEVAIDDDEPAAEDTLADADIEAQAYYLGDTDQALNNASGANLTGTITLEVDGTAYEGGLVTISGPSNLLFGNTNGDADTFGYAFGSFTAVLDENGEFDFTVWSNVAGEFTVKITAAGISETATVTFNDVEDGGAGAGIANAEITIDAASYVAPASTLIATITLKDEFGNGILTDAADSFVVEWDGPGLISGVLPDETSADGKARVYILFGGNETGSGTLTVTYWGEDGAVGGAADDADNVVATKTITLGAAPTAGKVNVGSFNGKLVVYAQGLDGKRISWKVGGNWGKAVAVGNTLNRFDRLTPRKGVTLSVDIYVDGVKTLTKSVVTR